MKRVLAIEDDPTCRRLVEEFVRLAGFDVVSCADGSQGWDKFCEEDFGVVITDYQMLGMNGIEVLERVRRAKPEIPVIIFTGATDTHLKKQAWDLGAFDFLYKPVNSAYLTQVLRAAYTFGLPKHMKSTEENQLFTPAPEWSAPEEENLFFNLVDAIGIEAVLETTHEFEKQSLVDAELLRHTISDANNTNNIARIAHRLKGSAASLGLKELTKVCTELENLAKCHQKQLQGFEKRIQSELKEALSSLNAKLEQVKKAS